MTRNKEMQVSCTLHFKGSKKYIAILKLGKKIILKLGKKITKA